MDVTSYLLGKKSGGGGPTPTGTISITENGTHDVTNYASANVNVSGGETLKISAGTTYKSGIEGTIDTIPELEVEGTSCRYMFANSNIEVAPRLKDTSNVTNMSYMFNKSPQITNYNLSNYDTSNVLYMNNMFQCSTAIAIRKLDLSNFNTQNVSNMAYMFGGLPQLAILDISSFDFSSVTNSNSMFSGCGNYSKQTDGAYADGIPYVYVKDTTAQNWILTNNNNGHPSTWTTDNVVIKSNL